MPDITAVCKSGKVVCERYSAREDGCMYSDEDQTKLLPLSEFPNCPWAHKQKLIQTDKPSAPSVDNGQASKLKTNCKKHGDDIVAFVITGEGGVVHLGPYCCTCMDEMLGGMLPKCNVTQGTT